MSSITNIPTNARTMSGQIIISDGVAQLENGNLSNVTSIDTDSLSTTSFNTNDLSLNTNIDLTGNTSKIQYTYPAGTGETNTLIERTKITSQDFLYRTFKNLGRSQIFNTALGVDLTLTKPLPDTVLIINPFDRNIYLPLISDVLGSGSPISGSSITFVRANIAAKITFICSGTNLLESLTGNNYSSFVWGDTTYSNVITLQYNRINAVQPNKWFLSPIFGGGNSTEVNVPLLSTFNTFGGGNTFRGYASVESWSGFGYNEFQLVDRRVNTSGNLPKIVCYANDGDNDINVFTIQPFASDVPFGVGGCSFTTGKTSIPYTLTYLTMANEKNTMYCNLDMDNNDINSVNNINCTTINGSPIGGAQTLSDVLTLGNSAQYQEITFIDKAKFAKSTAGQSNAFIYVENDSTTNTEPENLVVKRLVYNGSNDDKLFHINIFGIDSAGNEREFVRTENIIKIASSTAPKGQLKYYVRGGTSLMSDYLVQELDYELCLYKTGVQNQAVEYVDLSTGNYTIQAPYKNIYCLSIGTTANTITLPTAGGLYLGWTFVFRRVGGTTTTAINSSGSNIYPLDSITADNVILASGKFQTTIACILTSASTYHWAKIN